MRHAGRTGKPGGAPRRGSRLALALGLCCLPPALPGVARAEEILPAIRSSEAFDRCMAGAGGVTAGMVNCIGAETRIWDRRLNAAYAALMADPDHSAAAKGLLREAQRAWIAYRDKACIAEGEMTAEGGTLAMVSRASCALQMTAQRATDLERLRQPGN